MFPRRLLPQPKSCRLLLVSATTPPLPLSVLDFILTAQFAVAWAGEAGDEPRLKWWPTDMASEFGGEDLFKDLGFSTWRWASLQAAREAARRQDAAMRREHHNPDHLRSLYFLSFETDERLSERLQDLKRTHDVPSDALPGLKHVVGDTWSAQHFSDWLDQRPSVTHEARTIGRFLSGTMPPAPEAAVNNLLAALLPLSDSYALPHYRCEP